MKILLYIFVIILPLACSSNSDNDTLYDSYGGELEEMVLEENISHKAVMSSAKRDPGQKIIKNSYLRFETQDLDKTYNQIIEYVENNNGFIQNDNSNKSHNQLSRNVEIRIPTTNFQKTVDSISNHVAFFDTKRVSARDVTEEFIDLDARLKAKKTLEKRYLELLSKANNVKEMLEIERELSNIREEIEAKEGRIKYLQNHVSLSTLSVEFYKVYVETSASSSYATKMWNALKSGFNGISLFFLGLLHIWPFIILLIASFFIIKRWIKKRNNI